MSASERSREHATRRVVRTAAPALAMVVLLVGSAAAQDSTTTARVSPQPIVVQHYRPRDARGINVFEPPKEETVPYAGFKLQWGAAFTQQFQALHHVNSAPPNIVNNVDVNQLQDIGAGFNNANANLFMDAQLGRGLRVELTSYLSTRHHN